MTQAPVWNPNSDAVWVEQQAMLDRLFRPLEAVLVDLVRGWGARAVLDVGCGTGATTLAMARALAGQGHCTGLDLSPAMIEVAAARADAAGVDNAAFIAADAQEHPFAPGRVDAVTSRFGVMFFADPVAAFANLRRAVRPGSPQGAIAWRGVEDNLFMVTAARAAATVLPELPQTDPALSGQFAFADPDRVRHILVAAGWRDVEIAPLDVACVLPPADLTAYVTRMGPIGLMLSEMEQGRRAAVTQALMEAFEPFVEDGTARFTAACWLIRASS